MNLSDLIKKEREAARKAFQEAPDKNINYYYEDKLKRKAKGEIVDFDINEDQEDE